MKLGISILTHNYWEYTDRMLNSLIKNLKYPSVIVILDDASTDGSQEKIVAKHLATAIPSVMSVKYMFERDQIGLIKARNKTFKALIDEFNCDWIFLIHNDHMITEGTLDGLFEVFDKEPKAAIVGSEIFKTPEPPGQAELEKWAKKNYKQEWYRGNCHPVLMKVSALKEIMEDGNIYDESFGAQDNEDIDCLGRLEDLGYKTLVTKTSWAWHKGELSRSKHKNAAKEKQFSRMMYEKKWRKRGKPGWDHR